MFPLHMYVGPFDRNHTVVPLNSPEGTAIAGALLCMSTPHNDSLPIFYNGTHWIVAMPRNLGMCRATP